MAAVHASLCASGSTSTPVSTIVGNLTTCWLADHVRSCVSPPSASAHIRQRISHLHPANAALLLLSLLLLLLLLLQINAPHLLRYLAAAVVLNRKRRNNLRDLIKLIQQEGYEYSDPITQVRGEA